MNDVNKKSLIKNFNPAWFAAIMGTGILPIAVSFVEFHFKEIILKIFLAALFTFFIIIFVPWSLKFIFFFKEIKTNLKNPIISSFFPTMPISLIILSINLLKYPDILFNYHMSHSIALYLWIFGAIGIYIFSFVITFNIFCNQQVKYTDANFGWFIPPVSALIIPVAGFELTALFNNYSEIIFFVSAASFGVGLFLFLFVGAIVYHRYIYHELPINKLAPTLFIGATPTSIITIIIFKIFLLINHNPNTINIPFVLQKIILILNWGLSFWWFIMAILVTLYYIRKLKLPYALSWWAFTFPAGSISIATGIIWQFTNFYFCYILYLSFLIYFISIWLIVLARTVKELIFNNLLS